MLNRRRLLLWLPPLAFLGVFYFYPLAEILAVSLRTGQTDLRGLWSQLASPAVASVLWFTVWQAAVSTALTLLVGLPGAYLLARHTFPGKPAVRALTAVPFVLPTLVVAAAFNALLGPRGLVNVGLMGAFGLTAPPIAFTNTIVAIVVAHVFYNTTIVLRMVGDFWGNLDPDLGQAARMLGAGPLDVARRVTLPLLAPAIAAAALLVFIFDFTSFGVILVLGGPRFATLEVEIYEQAMRQFNLPLAALLSLVQLACTLALTIVYTRYSRRVSRPLELQSRRSAERPLASWRARLGAGALMAGLAVLLLAPLGALVVRSVLPVRSGRDAAAADGPTLQYYRALSDNPQQSVFYAAPSRAIGISLGYAAATVVLALGLGLPAAFALARDPESGLSRAVDPVIMLPLGTSAVTLGLGFLIALDHPPLDLRASPVLVPLAHTLVAFPFVVRSLVPALRGIRPQLREAAATLGASPARVIRYIDAPLVGRAMIVGATFAFMISIGEFGATALLARPEYPTMPVAIFRFLLRPGALFYGQAMALSTILMAVTAAGMIAIERFRVADVGEF